jgi:hypothetical protein
MSRRTKGKSTTTILDASSCTASSRRTKPTEHYFYGSSVSRASANPHAPSVFVPTDDRVGQWAAQVYPPPPSEESRVPSQYYDDTAPGPASQVYHAPAYAPTYPPASRGYNAPTYPPAFQAYNAPSYTPSYAPNHYYHTHVHWPQYAAMNYAQYANWESQGLGYAQSNRVPYQYQQAAPAPARPARYFVDARGNQVNIEYVLFLNLGNC